MAFLPHVVLPLLLPSLGQPMGPWLDEALPSAQAPISRVGACEAQHLANGVQLPESPDLYRIWNMDTAWGRPEMIEVITRTAEEMAWLAPDADPMVIGDISRKYGGELAPHISHRAGIDVDITLYWDDGRTVVGDYPGASLSRMDLATNWLVIRSLLDTGYVERILLDQRAINLLKRYTIETGQLTVDEAERIFPDPETRDRSATGIVHHAQNHQEHIHVRVLCRENA